MDLATDYMGLRLRNPLVASASPLSQTVDGVRRLADAGIGAVVVYSLFEEQLQGRALAPSGPPQNAEYVSPGEYRLPGGHDRGGERGGRGQVPARRSRRGDDRLVAAAARPDHVGTLLGGLTEWMAGKQYDSVGLFRGMLAVPSDSDQATYARAGYVSVLETAKFTYSRW